MQFTAHLDELGEEDEKRKKAKNQTPEHFKLNVLQGHIETVKASKTSKKSQSDNGALNEKDKIDNSKTQKHDEVFHETEVTKSSSKDAIKDVAIRVFASVLIFMLGYVVLNWNAVSTLFESKLNELRGVDVSEPYNGLVDGGGSGGEVALDLSNDPNVQRKQLPALDIDVVPPDMRIIIPKIGSNVPVVPVPTQNLIARDWGALEGDIQDALREGVVHYPGTAFPDQVGNVVLTGHSSYWAWDPGRFKDVFALLHQVSLKDKIVVFYEQKKFIYQVDEIKVIWPDKIDVLGPTDDSRLTLITCTPIGTNQKRLIVRAKLIEGELLDGTVVKTIED